MLYLLKSKVKDKEYIAGDVLINLNYIGKIFLVKNINKDYTFYQIRLFLINGKDELLVNFDCKDDMLRELSFILNKMDSPCNVNDIDIIEIGGDEEKNNKSLDLLKFLIKK